MIVWILLFLPIIVPAEACVPGMKVGTRASVGPRPLVLGRWSGIIAAAHEDRPGLVLPAAPSTLPPSGSRFVRA